MLSDRCLSCPVCNVGVLWPNAYMDQDEIWHACRSRPWPHCVRWGPSCPPPKGQNPLPIFGPYLLWPNGCMDQDATWYGGRPRPRPHCIRRGRSSPLKGAQPPVFCSCLLLPNGWMDEYATWYGSRSRPRPHCIRQGGPQLPAKGAQRSPLFGPCLLWRLPISATAELLLK